MQFTNNSYYMAMDDLGNPVPPILDTMEPAPVDEDGNEIIPDDAINLTPKQIGTTTNPMGNTLESLKARIREGNSKIEFSFIGQGKGNSQQPTPESFGTEERRDIRELLKINKMKTSTHASVHSQSLAGFTQEGFDPRQRDAAIKEIKKAIDFASEATKGGAIVFHFQEWQRPLDEIKDPMGKFRGYSTEGEDAQKLVVDKQTGKFVSGITKDRTIYRPKYKTAKDAGLVGQKDQSGHVLQADDWVDINNKYIPKDYGEDNLDRLFDRVPVFNPDKTRFEVDALTWNDLVKEANRYNEGKPDDKKLSPEELYARTELENEALRAMGNSLYHGRQYEVEEKRLRELLDIKKKYEEAKKNTPESERWKLQGMLKKAGGMYDFSDNPEKNFDKNIQFMENSLRHIHESSASADAQARELRDRASRLQSVERYGMSKTAETVATAAMEAMTKYNARKDKYKLEDPLFVAPENWDPRFFGSHPDEYKRLIDASRAKMQEQLIRQGRNPEEAKKLSETHIKGTLDIGHLNLWRNYFDPEGKLTPEERDKQFNKWAIEKTKFLAQKGYIGHIHLADNFGYDDEHLSPGHGNAPIKEFLKEMEKAGVRDIIVEPGSYNATREVSDTLQYIKSPIYGLNRRQRAHQTRQAHFGYNAPGFFIAGSYVPSNDWRPWTDLPLE